jgi:hypothetical protein
MHDLACVWDSTPFFDRDAPLVQVLATCQDQLRTSLTTNIKAALQLPSVDPALLTEVRPLRVSASGL